MHQVRKVEPIEPGTWKYSIGLMMSTDARLPLPVPTSYNIAFVSFHFLCFYWFISCHFMLCYGSVRDVYTYLLFNIALGFLSSFTGVLVIGLSLVTLCHLMVPCVTFIIAPFHTLNHAQSHHIHVVVPTSRYLLPCPPPSPRHCG